MERTRSAITMYTILAIVIIIPVLYLPQTVQGSTTERVDHTLGYTEASYTGPTTDATSHEESTSQSVKTVLNNTDPRLRPQVGGPPVEVKCGMYIISFGSINEISMDFELNMFFRQYWKDLRMAFDEGNDGVNNLILNARAINDVWTPDVFFTNEKKAAFHDVTVPNKRLRIFSNGHVIYSVRLSLTLSCPMDLSYFPMDKQTCSVGIESYAYDSREMTLDWIQDFPLEINPEMELPQFDLIDQYMESKLQIYETGGNYSRLKAVFVLKRQYGFYILQTFVPSILIIVLSWVSFWINKDAVPARISLSVTCVLTMTTQMTGSKSSVPKVSYPKAIDVWLSVCMIFVFAALLEYAFVNTLSRRRKKKEAAKKDKEDFHQETLQDEAEAEGNILEMIQRWLEKMEPASRLDKCSRIIFPAVFFIFNVIYWAVYAPI